MDSHVIPASFLLFLLTKITYKNSESIRILLKLGGNMLVILIYNIRHLHIICRHGWGLGVGSVHCEGVVLGLAVGGWWAVVGETLAPLVVMVGH